MKNIIPQFHTPTKCAAHWRLPGEANQEGRAGYVNNIWYSLTGLTAVTTQKNNHHGKKTGNIIVYQFTNRD
jgi:hypothetical protein